MSVKTELRALVEPLMAGGCHSNVNRDATISKPYAVVHQISGTPENGLAGYLGKTRYRFQVDVYADTPEQAEALSLGTVKTAITTSSLDGSLIFHSDGDYDDGTYQYITEYVIWAA